jgi:hypothetical protein
MSDSDSDDDDGVWEKPAWAKGGVQLKSTGKADVMKMDGNLAAPITYTPFKSQDHTNYVADPNKLNMTEQGKLAKEKGNLASPITNIRDEMKKKKKKKPEIL